MHYGPGLRTLWRKLNYETPYMSTTSVNVLNNATDIRLIMKSNRSCVSVQLQIDSTSSSEGFRTSDYKR